MPIQPPPPHTHSPTLCSSPVPHCAPPYATLCRAQCNLALRSTQRHSPPLRHHMPGPNAAPGYAPTQLCATAPRRPALRFCAAPCCACATPRHYPAPHCVPTLRPCAATHSPCALYAQQGRPVAVCSNRAGTPQRPQRALRPPTPRALRGHPPLHAHATSARSVHAPAAHHALHAHSGCLARSPRACCVPPAIPLRVVAHRVLSMLVAAAYCVPTSVTVTPPPPAPARPPTASNLTKIDRFCPPVSTKMGRVGVPSLTEIGRLGAPKMAKIGENRPPRGPKWLTRRPQINQNWPTEPGTLGLWPS